MQFVSRAPTASTRLAAFRKDSRGHAFVEFALMMPIMMLLLMGTLEVSMAYSAHRKMERTGASIADLLARQTSVPVETVESLFDISQVLITPFSADRFSITASYVVDDSGTPSTSWQCWNGVGAKASAPTTLPEGILEAGGSVVVVDVTYEHRSDITDLVVKAPITFSDRYYAKLRQSAFSSSPSGGICS